MIPCLQCSADYWQQEETPTLNYIKSIELTHARSGLDHIDAIYVINLDRRLDRMEHINHIFHSSGLLINRVSACDGKFEISESLIKELTGPYKNCMLYQGKYGSPQATVGCLLSHLSIIQDAHIRKFQTIWVLEDDVDIIKNPRFITDCLSELDLIDSEWDLFYTDPDPHVYPLGNYYTALDMISRERRPNQPAPCFSMGMRKITEGINIDRVYWRTGAHSMVISQRGIKKILNYFTHVYLFDHIDRELHLIPDILLYCSSKDIVTNSLRAEALKSDIHIMEEK